MASGSGSARIALKLSTNQLMPKEKLKRRDEFEFSRMLAPQTKMRMLLEVFDLGIDKDKNEERKKKFIELLGKYHQASISSKKSEVSSGITYNETSDKAKKAIHDQIMEIIRNVSLSKGPTKEQLLLAEYLSRNREEVEKMIETYFLGYNPSDPHERSELKQAMRGGGHFGSVPGKEDE